MRHLLVIALLAALSGCIAPVPSASAPAPGPGGKADGACYFGTDIDDIVDSGRFIVGDRDALTADSELTDEEQNQLLAGLPPGIRTLADAAAYADEGTFFRRSLESAADPDAPRFLLFTYLVSGEEGGFITGESDAEVLAFLVDGGLEECRYDGPAPAPAGGGACLFGATVDDLMERVIDGDFEYTDSEALTVDSELTPAQEQQLAAMVPVGGGGIAELFARSDNGEIEVGTLTSTATAHEPFTFYSFDHGDAQMGFIYTFDSFDRVALLTAGTWSECTVGPEVTPQPESGSCLFGATVNDLAAGFFDGSFEYTDEHALTIDSELTREQERQMGAMIPVGGGGVEVLFGQSDNGEIEVGTLVSVNTDHDAFTFYSYDRDGEQTGFVYTAGSLDRVAMLSNGSWVDCSVNR